MEEAEANGPRTTHPADVPARLGARLALAGVQEAD
jgi:hypothetical protein